MQQPKGRQHRLIAVVDRRVEALRLRRSGLSYQAIADVLGYSSRANAFRLVSQALHEVVEAEVGELRQLEAERLDALHAAVWPKAIRGHLPSIDRVLAIMKRRARLLGLDAPRRSVVVEADVLVQNRAVVAAQDAGLDAGVVWSEAERLLERLERGTT
jgi:hypothetical protein